MPRCAAARRTPVGRALNDGFSFPSRIEIDRPQEEYDITLNMLKVDINQPLKDEQFVLEQPSGAVVVNLDRPQSSLVTPLGQR